MKLPKNINAVTLLPAVLDQPYPPLGFCPIDEHQLGNGDTFGLYWPIGCEDSDPIVAETIHDELSVRPQFASLERFLESASKSAESDDDEDSFIDTPSIAEDPRSPAACVAAARDHLKSQDVEAAIDCLETAVSVLPEYSEAHALLCGQYRRVGRNDHAINAAIQCIISPPCFGPPAIQVAQWLSRQKTALPEIASDPIWINREKLSMKFGGVHENDQYKVLCEAIDQYLSDGAYVQAMRVMQTYSQLMYSETISFQERNSYDRKEFFDQQCHVAASLYGKSRVLTL